MLQVLDSRQLNRFQALREVIVEATDIYNLENLRHAFSNFNVLILTLDFSNLFLSIPQANDTAIPRPSIERFLLLLFPARNTYFSDPSMTYPLKQKCSFTTTIIIATNYLCSLSKP